jgi:hypothetical protein
MPDIYSSLIGAAPTDAEQQAAVAEALRRRRSFGELGSLTGDKVLQPFGQGLSKQADEYAGAIQDTRQKDIDDAQTKAYQTDQIRHMDESMAEQIRNNDLDYKARMAEIAQRKAEAELKADAPKFTKMTDATRGQMISAADTFQGLGDALNDFKDEYTQRFGPGPQSALSNTLSMMGLSTDEMDEAQRWWGNYKEIRTLPTRNKLFGATLSDKEKKEWDSVDINPNMKPEQIRAALNDYRKLIMKSTIRRARGMKTEKFDPEVINEYTAGIFEGQDPTQFNVTSDKEGVIDRGGGEEEKIISFKYDKDGKLVREN